jgi:hypothetical protein
MSRSFVSRFLYVSGLHRRQLQPQPLVDGVRLESSLRFCFQFFKSMDRDARGSQIQEF